MSQTKPIVWRIHLASSPDQVYALLDSPQGRGNFWAESAVEQDGVIHFIFPDGIEWSGKVLERTPDQRFRLVYYGGSITTFELEPDGKGGTDLVLTDENVPAAHHAEVTAGWVSVLMALKGFADWNVDLRNHDPQRTWDHGYADN